MWRQQSINSDLDYLRIFPPLAGRHSAHSREIGRRRISLSLRPPRAVIPEDPVLEKKKKNFRKDLVLSLRTTGL